MKPLFGALIAFAALLAAANQAQAQVYQVYYPAPVTTYYAPGPVTVAPAPTVAYYPSVVPVTRYRPLIGGTVTRWRYVNQPTYVYPSTVTYYPVW
jgi:hypothetical protein